MMFIRISVQLVFFKQFQQIQTCKIFENTFLQNTSQSFLVDETDLKYCTTFYNHFRKLSLVENIYFV